MTQSSDTAIVATIIIVIFVDTHVFVARSLIIRLVGGRLDCHLTPRPTFSRSSLRPNELSLGQPIFYNRKRLDQSEGPFLPTCYLIDQPIKKTSKLDALEKRVSTSNIKIRKGHIVVQTILG